ncbi:MAG: hypothetical protein AAGE98_21895 [Actinomycetota bacterium]
MSGDRLRLATALVHTLPGAALVAVGRDGRTLTVGRHPSADVDPCRWRSVVVGDAGGRVSGLLDGLELSELGGSLETSAGGAVVDRTAPERRWFAVALPPCIVVDVLRGVDLRGLPEEAVTATLRPDPELGVTVVGVGIDAPYPDAALDELATDVAAALAVAELCAALPVIDG